MINRLKCQLLIVFIALGVATSAWASDSKFINLYDSGKFEEAAKQLEGLDTANADVARRLGVMYYSAKGVERDQAKGRALLEQAMMAGDATAAVNLAKIYFKIEKNSPKAAWCLMVAEGLKDASVKDDVEKLRGYLGDDYLRGVVSYVAQLRDLLSSEQAALENKTAEANRERMSLTRQITSCQEESKKMNESIAHEREEFKLVKDDLGKKLAAAEEASAADKKKIEEVSAKLALAISDGATRDELIEKLKREYADATANVKKAEESLVGYKKIVKTMEVGSLNKGGDVEQISRKEIFARYNQLVSKYNLLAEKYNKLLRVSQSSLSNNSEK